MKIAAEKAFKVSNNKYMQAQHHCIFIYFPTMWYKNVAKLHDFFDLYHYYSCFRDTYPAHCTISLPYLIPPSLPPSLLSLSLSLGEMSTHAGKGEIRKTGGTSGKCDINNTHLSLLLPCLFIYMTAYYCSCCLPEDFDRILTWGGGKSGFLPFQIGI